MFKTSLQYIFVFTLLMSGFLIGGASHAQQFQLYSADDIFVETIPEIPGPNEQVDLKLTSYSFNLNNYYIAWFKDGERISADFGNREFRFTTGNSGDVTNIAAVVQFEGQVFRKELRFAPSQIDLLWEATDAYTPPFYKGKALPIQQSEIRVTAIPETLLIEPTDAPNLVYYWDKNYKRQVGASGFGKQSYTLTADPLTNTEKITVTSNDRRENSFAKNTIDIPITENEPKILFYEIDENERLLTQRSLATNNIINDGIIKFSFHPLNFSTTKKNFTDLFVGWKINNVGQPPQDFAKQNELYVSSNGEKGASRISVTLEGIEKIMQKNTEEINLIFN